MCKRQPPTPFDFNATPTRYQNRQTQTVEPQDRVCYAFRTLEHRKHLKTTLIYTSKIAVNVGLEKRAGSSLDADRRAQTLEK